jgi:hypothetical protein
MKKKTSIKPKNIVRKKKVEKIDPPKSALDKWCLWFYSKLNYIFGK